MDHTQNQSEKIWDFTLIQRVNLIMWSSSVYDLKALPYNIWAYSWSSPGESPSRSGLGNRSAFATLCDDTEVLDWIQVWGAGQELLTHTSWDTTPGYIVIMGVRFPGWWSPQLKTSTMTMLYSLSSPCHTTNNGSVPEELLQMTPASGNLKSNV